MFAGDARLPDAGAIRAARERIRDRVPQTPLLQAPDLSAYMAQPLWLKAENLQRTGSFKARGATNWVETATPEEMRGGLITVSAGNHALALAWAAGVRKVPVKVVMPEGSSPMKVEETRKLGGEVVLHGTIHEAVALCRQFRDDLGLTLVHPYNDARVMAGQGTVGLEILEQCPQVQRILCPIGGGGLISGIGIAVKDRKPGVELIGVEPTGAATMRNAWDHNDAEASLERVETIAGSLAPAVVGDLTYAASRAVVDDIVLVGDESIREATRLMLSRARLYVETGAAVGLAALLEGAVDGDQDGTTVLVLTGGNMDLPQVAALVPAPM